MLIVKITEQADGTIVAETQRQVLARFKNEARADVIAYLEHKARECQEQLRVVEEFEDDPNERLTERDYRHLMKRSF